MLKLWCRVFGHSFSRVALVIFNIKTNAANAHIGIETVKFAERHSYTKTVALLRRTKSFWKIRYPVCNILSEAIPFPEQVLCVRQR